MANLISRNRLFETFDRVVCVNLDRRSDRWNGFQSRLRQANWPFRDIERFRAVDGDRVCSPAWINCGNGAWGCLRSHIRILEDALVDGLDSILILEDDVTFAADFSNRVRSFFSAIPSDWDGVLLGGQHLVRPEWINEQVVRVLQGNRTHAHGYNANFIRTAYHHLCDFVAHAQTPEFHVDHRLGVLHMRGDGNVYAPSQWLCGQSDGSSDISGRAETFRDWADSIRVIKPHDELEQPQVALRANKVTVVAVVGLYRSGCRAVVSALESLGAFTGETDGSFLEEVRIRELCRNFFCEPSLVELVPSSGRIRLLRQWCERNRYLAAASGREYMVVKHPLLALMTDDLIDAFGPKLKIIYVERELEDAIEALKRMAWKTFEGAEEGVQVKLSAALNNLNLGADSNGLRISYAQLRNQAKSEIHRIMDFLEWNCGEEIVESAVSAISPF